MPISFNEDFPHDYVVRSLPARPAILPLRYFVYPKLVDEIEKEALLLEITPKSGTSWTGAFALGFAEPSVVNGVFACPDANGVCVIAGGYAYLVNTLEPSQFVHLHPRPVVRVLPVPESRLLLLCDFTTIMALGADGVAWETPPLSWEGLSLECVENSILHGTGWDAIADREMPFTVDLVSGHCEGGAAPPKQPIQRDGRL